MLDYYYVIIIILVFLKVLFWTFYFYIRAQRIRNARARQSFVIVETRSAPMGYSDQTAILRQEVLPATSDRPPVVMSPPAYEDVLATDNKPPSYEQAVGTQPQVNQSSAFQVPASQSDPRSIPVVIAQTGSIRSDTGVRQ